MFSVREIGNDDNDKGGTSTDAEDDDGDCNGTGDKGRNILVHSELILLPVYKKHTHTHTHTLYLFLKKKKTKKKEKEDYQTDAPTNLSCIITIGCTIFQCYLLIYILRW